MNFETVSLGDLLTLERRKVVVEPHGHYPEVGVYCFGRGLFHKEPRSGLEVGNKPLFKIMANDFILQVTFAWEGAVALAAEKDEGLFGSIRVLTFRVDENRCLPDYLVYYFKTPEAVERLGRISPGSAGRNRVLSAKRIPEVFVPLPTLSEQRRIVAKIERLAAKVKEAEAIRRKGNVAAERLIDAVLVRIFEDESDNTWSDGCLGDYVVDDCYGTSEKTHDEPIGYPILRMGNIQNGVLDARDLKYLQISEKDYHKWILRSGDILVNRTNSAELVGKCAVFDLEGEWGYASYIIRLRLDTAKANPYLVARYINSSLGREYMFRERKQMTGQANVNAQKLKRLPIKLPPIQRQKEVIESLNGLQAQVDELRGLQTKTAAELNAMLPSILDRAFKGEL